MKKLFSFILIIILALSMVGCAQLKGEGSQVSTVASVTVEAPKKVTTPVLDLALQYGLQEELIDHRMDILAEVAIGYSAAKADDKFNEVLDTIGASDDVYDLIKAGFKFVERRVYDEALAVVDRLELPNEKGVILREMVKHYAQQGNVARAVELGNLIEESIMVEQARGEIVIGYLQENNFEKAIELTKGIHIEDIREFILFQIGFIAAQVGELEIAYAMIEALEDEYAIDDIYTHTAIFLAKAGKHDEAVEECYNIVELRQRGRAFREIGLYYLENGDQERVEEMIQAIEDKNIRIGFTIQLAEIAINQGELDYALVMAHRVEEEVVRSRSIGNVAFAIGKSGDLDRAVSIIQEIEDFDFRADNLKRVVALLAVEGQYDRAFALAEGIEREDRKALAFIEIAMAYLIGGDLQKALEVVEDYIEESYQLDWGYRSIAHHLISENNDLAKAIEVTMLMANPWEQFDLLLEMLILFVEEDQEIRDVLALTIEKADLALPIYRYETISYLSRKLVPNGRYNLALESVNYLREPGERARALAFIGTVMHRNGHELDSKGMEILKQLEIK